MFLRIDSSLPPAHQKTTFFPALEDLKHVVSQVAFALFHPPTRHQRLSLRLRLLHWMNPMVLLSGWSCKLLRGFGESQTENTVCWQSWDCSESNNFSTNSLCITNILSILCTTGHPPVLIKYYITWNTCSCIEFRCLLIHSFIFPNFLLKVRVVSNVAIILFTVVYTPFFS